MDQEKIKKDWAFRGYSFGIFKDPPGKIWADFIHRTDELVVLAEGEIEIEIEGKPQKPQVGDEVFIPANARHTVRNVGSTNNVWYYGYKNT
jgi:quercetin dioxygenase-like cupin family protein